MEASMTYEEQIEARQENTALRARLAEVEKENAIANQRLKTIKELCGCVEDGSNTSICIGQDDATKTWSICYSRTYKSIAWEDSFEQMLDKAGEALTRLEEGK